MFICIKTERQLLFDQPNLESTFSRQHRIFVFRSEFHFHLFNVKLKREITRGKIKMRLKHFVQNTTGRREPAGGRRQPGENQRYLKQFNKTSETTKYNGKHE